MIKPKGAGKMPKAFKKGQVVHVCDWLMNYFHPVIQPFYWAAGDKRDDVADCFLQIISFINRHVGPKLKREARKKPLEVMSFAQKRAAYYARWGISKAVDITAESNDDDIIMDNNNNEDESKTCDNNVPPVLIGMKVEEVDVIVVDDDDEVVEDGIVIVNPCTALRTKYRPSAYTSLGIERGLHTFPEGNHYVYLLASVSPQSSYIGYTIAPLRRYLQHCCIYAGGAKATRASKTWEPAIVVSGFSAKVYALSFESTWQKFKARRIKQVKKKNPEWSTPVSVARKHRTLPTKLRKLAGALRNKRFSSMPNLEIHFLWGDAKSVGNVFPKEVNDRLA